MWHRQNRNLLRQRPILSVRKRQGGGGQSAVEFALAVPVLVLLFLATVELGRMFYFTIQVSNAARAGVQYGALSIINASDNTGMQNAAISDASNVRGLTADASHYCVCSNGTSAPNCKTTDCSGGSRMEVYVQVTTSAPFQSLTGFAGIVLPSTLTGNAVMRVSQ